ncbi:MAG: HDOD domain-containing protein [Saccharospirillaceae bacterium]|nr:HDOD domain-containing protein [Pseudomonadales bacterium]NRB80847.1 HDOD domain-containing protein [Saccharospirillaceae bacterium]
MSFESLFTNAKTLPNIPKVVQELIASFENPDVDFDEVSNKVSMDPVLSAKVLRMANSAHYGVSRSIENISDGVVLLGFPALRTMVLASGIAGSMTVPKTLDRRQFWSRNFLVAEITKRLAKHCDDVDPESAFTAGMIHAIGELLIHAGEPEKAEQIQEAIKLGGKLKATEESILGYTYVDVSAELATRWKFPLKVVDGLKYQSAPEKAENFSEIAALIRIAKYLYEAQMNNVDENQIKRDFPLELALKCKMDTQTVMKNIAQVSSLETAFTSVIEDVH